MSKKIVTIFGGHAVSAGDKVYEEAMTIGRILAENGYTIRSGGYAGVMEAVSKGSLLANRRPTGIGLANRPEEAKNEYIEPGDFTEARDITQRTKMLIDDAEMIIAMPGGIGTLGELFTSWACMLMGGAAQTPRIILFGKCWDALLSVLTDHFAVARKHTDNVVLCSDLEAFLSLVVATPDSKAPQRHATPDVQRWDSRAGKWNDLISDPSSYVNAEQGYARFDEFLLGCIGRRLPPHIPLVALDLACGTGAATANLVGKYSGASRLQIDGMDFSSEMTKIATAARLFRNIYTVDLNTFEPEASAYDLIFSRGITMSRLREAEFRSVIARLANSLTPSGILVFDALNALWADNVPASGKRHASLPALQQVLHRVGLRVIDIEGLARRTMNVCCARNV